VLIWEGAVDLIGWHEPMQWPGEDGSPDRFNALRPIIGHGPESMYVAYNRVYPPDLAHFEKRNASPDRSHNETLDALITTGWLGGAVYLFLFGSVFYYAFKWLGLLTRPWQRWTLVGLWAGGAILGLLGVWAWRGPAYIGVGIPLGAMAGVVLYILIVLGLATRDRETWLPTPRPYQIWVLALISAIAAHFVEIQFGIAIAATRTYFWLYAAAMVVVGSRLMLPAEELEPTAAKAETEAAGSVSSKRRRRQPAASPVAHPAAVQRRAWLGSLLVLSVLGLLVLSTMLFNATTPQEGYPGPLETIWRSLTRTRDDQSLVMLVLFLTTWGMFGMAGLSELAVRGDGEGKKPADWLAAAGIFALISIGGALLFGIFHAMRLKPVTISQNAYANPLANTITFYYVAFFVQVLALGLALAFRSRHSLRTIAWRWTGQLSDAAVAGLIVFLPVLAGLAIFASNISIVRADIVYKEALSSEKVGQWDAAIYLYERAVDLAEEQDFYHLFLGRAYIEKARLSQGEERQIWLQESERALARAREIAPLNTDHSRNLAKLYLSWASFSAGATRQPLLEQALEYSADATQLSPNTADIWNERAQIFLTMDDYEQAEAMYQQSLSLDAQYPQTHLSLGQLYTSQKEWESAIQAFNTAAELQPKAVDAYSMLGYVYSQNGNLQQAGEAYEQAVELRPRNYLDRKNLAIVYSQMGQNDEAIREATEALALAPEDQKPSLEAFLAQLDSGQPISSPQDTQQFEELLNAGQAQLQAEDWPAALDSYNQVVELDPNNAVAHSALAYIYARQGDLDKAIEENLAVVSLLPNDYNSYKNLAILYRQKGMMDEAISAAEKALTLAPEQDKEALRVFIEQAKDEQGSSSSTAEPGTQAGDLPPAQRDGMYNSSPPLIIDPEKTYQATIVTEKGEIVIGLFAERAPETVNNFVFLAREGFYDDTTFHRVLPGFMAQAGDPTGTGRGGPGYRFPDEFDPTLRHDGPGILSMANSGANTNGSQFFITYGATPWLDDAHAVFGQVVEGMDVLSALTPRDPTQNPDFAGDKILRITIQEQ
jgi:cyclophilin family peptidyl-prolyl cis-trans isomerase/tetratricopeptide (TPR) repeat protein